MKTIKTLILATAAVIGCGTILAAGQPFEVSGRITDDGGNPLAKVTVMAKTGGQVSISDTKGYYKIKVDKGGTLTFVLHGYQTECRTAGKSVIDVQMYPETTVLQSEPACDMVMEEEVLKSDFKHMSRAKHEAGKVNAIIYGGSYTGEAVAVSPAPLPYSYDNMDTEEYAVIRENRFVNVAKDPLSTFSLEVDGASYSNVRRMLGCGARPENDAVRVEEFVNYFSYDYPKPTGSDPLKISHEVAPCPWNAKHKLVKIGVKAREIPSDNLPAANFVFLVDVSGSMYGGNRLPLVKSSLKLLINNLRDKDRVAIVTYAGSAGVALTSTPGTDKQKIREALDNLEAGGSTAGGEGIKLAYKIARQNFVEGGNNRIILATDGDFNVGVSSADGLQSLIEQERKSGVFLTVLGYGMGNYKDKLMQVLAEKGNGNYAYIENMQEANKVLVNEFGGTMYAVAKDVKLQVEFNPARVQAFRLVGYESRLLEHEDFNDDTKDAGEIGAGHSVTAFYEIVPVGVKSDFGGIDPLKYQLSDKLKVGVAGGSDELMTVKLRYKAPDGDVSRKMEVPVSEGKGGALSEDFYFASAVAMFGQLLRDSDFKGDATYDKVIEQARKGLSDDEYGYRREFLRLVETAKGMTDLTRNM